MARPRVFVCYSGKDKKPYLEELLEVLKALRNEGLLDPWHDESMIPGDEWKGKIDEAIETSSIFIALISESMLGSDHCDHELKVAEQRKREGNLRIVPVGVREADWPAALKKYDPLPEKKDKPVSKYGRRDKAWKLVKQGIRAALAKIPSARPGESDSLDRWIIEQFKTHPELQRLLGAELGTLEQGAGLLQAVRKSDASSIVIAFHNVIGVAPNLAPLARKVLGAILARCFDYEIDCTPGPHGLHDVDTKWKWLGIVLLAKRYGGAPMFVVDPSGEVCGKDVLSFGESGVDPTGTGQVRQLTQLLAQKFKYAASSEQELRARVNRRLAWLASPENRLETGWTLLIDPQDPIASGLSHVVPAIHDAFPALRILRIRGGGDPESLDGPIHFALEDIYRES